MSEPHTSRVRASDTEREEVATLLRAAMGEGRLTLDEGEQRLAAGYAATYRDQLPELTADLPPVESQSGGRPGDRRGDRRGDRPGEWAARWFRSGRPRPVVPVIGLVVVAVVLAGLWAVSAGGPVWPVILFGVLAIVLAKRGRRHWHGGAGHPCHGRPGRVSEQRQHPQ